MTVYAIDPGPHTGIVWRLADKQFRSITLDYTTPGALRDAGLELLYDWLTETVDIGDTVVLESFEFRKEEKPYIVYATGEYVGIAKLFCLRNDITLRVQNASTGKGFWDDDKLKRAGLYSVCDTKHSRDAMRHWLRYHTFELKNEEYLFKLK
jgi:hypothetical protein